MFKHYFVTAWRSLKANKFYSILNISGLSLGLAAGIMLLLWVKNERSYDKFHLQYRNIYEVNSQLTSNDQPVTFSVSPGSLSVIAQQIPGIASFVRLQYESGILSNPERNQLFDQSTALYVDSTFMDIFDFNLIKGDSKHFLRDKQSIAITREMAIKLFGTDHVIGRKLQYNKDLFKISSVMEDFPTNSSISADIVIPMSRTKGWNGIDADMSNYYFDSYALLYPGADPNAISKKISDIFFQQKSENFGPEVQRTDFMLQNLGDKHLVRNDGNKSALRVVQIILLVALLILLIASINYVNLSTARSLIRMKEVAVRKIIGATRTQLFLQFICETFLIFVFALIISIGIIYLLMPLYNRISGKELSFSLFNLTIIRSLGIAFICMLIVSSVYPAMLLSSFRPAKAMNGKTPLASKSSVFRKILVVLQFTVSFMLLVGTLVMAKQMHFIQHKDLGFDKSYVFTVDFPDKAKGHLDAVKSELMSSGTALGVGLASSYISDVETASTELEWQGKPANGGFFISQLSVDNDFLKTMKFTIVQGSGFSGKPSDSSKFLLNETAVKQMGLKSPCIGQQVTFHGTEGNIVGVLKDFNFQPLTKQISPIIVFTGWQHKILYVRTTSTKAQAAIAATKKVFQKYAGDTPFKYEFLDKKFESHYNSERRVGTLFNTFAAIAIFISCLGLFGLATYTAQVKTKETGIRKVLGASVGSIVKLISRDFLKLVLIAMLIAAPLAYWATNRWLNNFAFRIHVEVLTFVIAALIMMLIAFGTIGFKAFKAARANPIKSLKTD